MEPTEQAKPPRKRRRWLIIALLLMLVTGIAWWQWPRGDARFVGKWSIKVIDPKKSFHFGDLQFKSNGRGRTIFAKTFFPWRVENDEIVTGYTIDGGWLKRLSSIETHVSKWTGASVVTHEWRVQEVGVE